MYMKPIWYFVGLLLLVLGAIILLNGLYLLFSPSGHDTVLGHTHPDIWWGALMTVAGLLFLVLNRKTTVQ
jgi:hypothetical protein